jgi:hypothetical protein
MISSGVTWYAKGTIVHPVFFPHGEANCRHCDYLIEKKERKTFHCVFTGEFIEYHNLDNRGQACPIVFEETEF